MDTREIEMMMRRVVREELAALLQGHVAQEPANLPAPIAGPTRSGNPFLLSEPELKQAERMLPEEERPILRTRVMAARLEEKGNESSARRMRMKADRMEKQLEMTRGRKH